jgi:hypothetical protein
MVRRSLRSPYQPSNPYLVNMNLSKVAFSLGASVLALSAVAFSWRAPQDEMPSKQTPQHQLLQGWLGTWDATLDMPGFGIEGSKGISTREMVGKLWLVDRYEGDMMGMAFQGHGVTGYDSEKERFVGMWVDSWTDRMLTFEGTYEAATRTLRFDVPGRNPVTGEAQTEVHETRMVSDDVMEFRMLWPGEDGEVQPVMVIRYERRK